MRGGFSLSDELPIAWKKVHHPSPIQQFIIRVSFCTTVMIQTTGASLLLVVEGRALIRNRALSSRGQGAYLFFWKSAECKTKLWCLLDWGSKRLENSLIVRGPFLARTTCRAIVAKDRIFRFKKLSTNSIIVEKLRRRLLFCREASREQSKEDGPRLISVFKHSSSAINETE